MNVTLCTALSIAVLYVSDIVSGLALLYFGFDIGYYQGLYSMATSVLGISFLLIISRFAGMFLFKTGGDLIRVSVPRISMILFGIAMGLALLAFVTTYMRFARIISEYLDSMKESVQEYSDHIKTYDDEIIYPVWDQILYIISLIVIVPFEEEIAFRGIAYGSISKVFSPGIAAVISAVLFGILHGVSLHIGYAIIAGLFMALTYYAYDNLIVSVIVHSVFNFFGSGLYYISELTGFDTQQLFGLYTIQFMMTVPALFFLAKKIYLKNHGQEETANEQA